VDNRYGGASHSTVLSSLGDNLADRVELDEFLQPRAWQAG